MSRIHLNRNVTVMMYLNNRLFSTWGNCKLFVLHLLLLSCQTVKSVDQLKICVDRLGSELNCYYGCFELGCQCCFVISILHER
jgi:hypothetical protein